MFCRKCGKELRDDDVFCSKCGAKVEPQTISSEPEKPQPASVASAPPSPRPAPTTAPQSKGGAGRSRMPRSEKIVRIVLLSMLIVMLGSCFLSCAVDFAQSFKGAAQETLATDDASTSAGETVEPSPTAKPTATPKPTPTPTPATTTAAQYKDTCRVADYDAIARYPSEYDGKDIKVTGEVAQVAEGWFDSVTMRLRTGDSYDDYKYWMIHYTRKGDNESRILEGDTVTVYGECGGVETYTTILGSTNTIPSVEAAYIDISK